MSDHAGPGGLTKPPGLSDGHFLSIRVSDVRLRLKLASFAGIATRTWYFAPDTLSDRASAVAEYIGLKQIAERLKCSVPTVRKMHALEGLLLYRQPLARLYPERNGMARRSWAWMTTDELLHTWLVARCIADRQFIPPGAARRRTPPVPAEATRGR